MTSDKTVPRLTAKLVDLSRDLQNVNTKLLLAAYQQNILYLKQEEWL